MNMRLVYRRVLGDPPEWWHLRASVRVDDEALAALRSNDERVSERAEHELFKAARIAPIYYGGPGRAFAHEPGWGYRRPSKAGGHLVRIFQRGGLDI